MSDLIAPNDIHVWHASLQCSDAELAACESILSADESRRAARFHFERDRRRFIAARGLLRQILAQYLESTPRSLLFRYGPAGKPELDLRDDSTALRFNLSHSGERMLLAVSNGRAVGVDIERIDTMLNVMLLARDVFSVAERAALQTAPRLERAEAFFNGWTRKEAFIKAKGGGLSIPLQEFDVSILPESKAALLRTGWNRGEVTRWTMRKLAAPRGYAAALVAEGFINKVRVFQCGTILSDVSATGIFGRPIQRPQQIAS